MKLKFYVLIILVSISLTSVAQDEGVIVKKERIGNDKSLFLDFGPSFTLGKNIGDYKTGFNFEIGFTKRLNRLLSVGPSISYVAFNYDPDVTSIQGGNAYVGHGDPNNWKADFVIDDYDYGYILKLEGGDLSLTSLAVSLKLNLVPVKDKSIISAYVFAKPFVSYSSRTEVKGSDTRYTYQIYEDSDGQVWTTSDDTWYPDGFTSTWDGSKYDALKAKNKITGGIFVGPGIELFPAKKFSFYLQASFGYTLPVSYVSTKSYDNTVSDYVKKEFPMVTKGFPSVNVQVGGAFNF
ncbi:MAG TPA: hypothetical protein VL443_05810 [Cyclobacteriaceae bacterium]|nr:hypothetical protein [Cyclobacteriaceae bacterium]